MVGGGGGLTGNIYSSVVVLYNVHVKEGAQARRCDMAFDIAIVAKVNSYVCKSLKFPELLIVVLYKMAAI